MSLPALSTFEYPEYYQGLTVHVNTVSGTLVTPAVNKSSKFNRLCANYVHTFHTNPHFQWESTLSQTTPYISSHVVAHAVAQHKPRLTASLSISPQSSKSKS